MSKKPVVRQIAWPAVLVQCLILFLCMWFWNPELVLLIYLLASISLKMLIPRNHRKGISLFRAGKYEDAVKEFEKSYEFFAKHAWIDRCRFFVLLSPSQVSYREMSLLNIAYCSAQAGNGAKAKEFYEKTLAQFPGSEMAASALRMIQATEKSR